MQRPRLDQVEVGDQGPVFRFVLDTADQFDEARFVFKDHRRPFQITAINQHIDRISPHGGRLFRFNNLLNLGRYALPLLRMQKQPHVVHDVALHFFKMLNDIRNVLVFQHQFIDQAGDGQTGDIALHLPHFLPHFAGPLGHGSHDLL